MTKQKRATEPDGLSVERVTIESLTLDPSNVRLHPATSIEAIKGSLARFGQQKPIVVGGDGVVVAGNGTLAAARELGWSHLSIVRTKLTGTDAVAFAIADNRTAEVSEWDKDALAKVVAAMKDEDEELVGALGFDEAALAGLVGLVAAGGGVAGDGGGVKSDAESAENEERISVPENPVSVRGTTWNLDAHRVACGDCRDAGDVARLLDGARINVAVTSPPYASQRKYDETSGFVPIHPDAYVDWFDDVQRLIADHIATDGSWFVNIKEHCDDGQRSLYVKDLTLAHVRRWGWRFVDEFVWTHGGTPKAVNQRFKNGWEPIFQFARDRHKFRPDAVMRATGSIPDWSGKHPNAEDIQGLGWTAGMERQGVDPRKVKQAQSNANSQGLGLYNGGIPDDLRDGMAYPSNVLSVGKNREAVGHPAAYPIGLPDFFIRAFSDESDVVYDPFLGSGTTLIAAELLNRRCYGMELSPAYVDVIVQRWQNRTGKRATHAETGEPFPVEPTQNK